MRRAQRGDVVLRRMPHFEVIVEPPDSDGERVMRLIGELDAVGAGILAAAVGELARDDMIGKLVLDLGEVTFVDSSGLRVLLASERELLARGSGFGLRSVPPYAMRLLRITDLADHFEIDEKP